MTVASALRSAARPVLSPHEYAYRRSSLRRAYTATARRRQHGAIERGRALLGRLPDPSPWRIPAEDGFRSFAPGTFPADVQPALAVARRIVAERAGHVEAKASKSWFRHLLRDDDLVTEPALLDLVLDERVVAMVADYLGELPVLTSVWLWQSVPVPDANAGSQLFHADYDDVTQLKLFLHVDDVTGDNGPLTAFPAAVSTRAMTAMRYAPGEHGHLDDDVVMNHLGAAEPVRFEGPAGTVDAVDTSRVLHRGSREQTRDRFVLGYQLTTHSSFLVNALRRRPSYPHASLAGTDPVRAAVLTGG